ncbi:MAG: argininosuccinate synthase domain-containing protein, partial [Planctomycetota bacterium]
MSNTTPRTPAPRVARYEATPGQVKKALLLFSGGLDSSVMVHWLRENYGCEVVCFTLNLGDPHLDGEEIKAKAIKLGAAEAHCIDVIDRYAEEMLAPAILANADYQGGYHLSCPLGRVMISSEAVRIA